jgi:hypothetical protein
LRSALVSLFILIPNSFALSAALENDFDALLIAAPIQALQILDANGSTTFPHISHVRSGIGAFDSQSSLKQRPLVVILPHVKHG